MNILTGPGAQTLTVRYAKSPPATEVPRERTSDGVGMLEKLGSAVVETGVFAFNELSEVAKNDPALALRYGATSISDKLLEGTGPTVRDGFGKAIVPVIRLSVLGANVFKVKETFADPGAHWAEKSLDIARVATDVIGLAGSVMKYAFPTQAALGDTLVGVSYAADAVSHSVRLLTHGATRVNVWKKDLAERKAEKQATSQNPTPPVAPAPVSPTAPLLMGNN